MAAISLGTSSAGQGVFTSGWQSIRGWGAFSEDKKGLVTNPPNSGMPEFFNGPSPEVLFQVLGLDRIHNPYSEDGVQKEGEVNVPVSNHKCTNMLESQLKFMDNYNQAFVKANLDGYKTRTQEDGNMKTNFNFPTVEGDTSLPHLKGREGITATGKISPDIMNEEYVTFKKGYRSVAPDNGRNLPGTMTTNLKGSNVGPQIWTTPRYGYNPNGYYSGWQSTKWNANGLVYVGKTN